MSIEPENEKDDSNAMWQLSVMRLACHLTSNTDVYKDSTEVAKENFMKNPDLNSENWTKEQQIRMTGVEIGIRAALMHEGLVMGIQYAQEILTRILEQEKNKLIVPKQKKIIT